MGWLEVAISVAVGALAIVLYLILFGVGLWMSVFILRSWSWSFSLPRTLPTRESVRARAAETALFSMSLILALLSGWNVAGMLSDLVWMLSADGASLSGPDLELGSVGDLVFVLLFFLLIASGGALWIANERAPFRRIGGSIVLAWGVFGVLAGLWWMVVAVARAASNAW